MFYTLDTGSRRALLRRESSSRASRQHAIIRAPRDPDFRVVNPVVMERYRDTGLPTRESVSHAIHARLRHAVMKRVPVLDAR